MKKFELNDDALQKGWGAEGQYWFSLNNYTLKEDTLAINTDIPEDMTNEEYALSKGYIPFFHIKRIELAKAYVRAVDNKKLLAALSKYSDEEYIEAFWRYFNAYPDIFDRYESFQRLYLIARAEQWCKDNKIEYSL